MYSVQESHERLNDGENMKKRVLICLIMTVIACISCTMRDEHDGKNEEITESQNDISSQTEEITVLPWEEYDADQYSGLDVELTFWHTQHDDPIGIWSKVSDTVKEKADEVIITPGDIYVNYIGEYSEYIFDGLTIKSYLPESSTPESGTEENLIYQIYTDRTDIYTYRGIHVGSTLDEVKSAYEGEMPSSTVQNGIIEYQDKEYWGSFGPNLYFYIENDTVSAMELKYSPKQ